MLAGIVAALAIGIILDAVAVVRERRQAQDLRRRLDEWQRRNAYTLNYQQEEN
jgi:hypothetical protein